MMDPGPGPNLLMGTMKTAMKKRTDEVTALVVDTGLFLPLAQRLGRFYKRIVYWRPNSEAFPRMESAVIGDGFENIDRVDDPWKAIDEHEIDLAVFPDIGNAGMQLHLESIGIPVWGNRRADSLEQNREKFFKTLKAVGLPVPDYEKVVGITKLREHLKHKEDCYLKISKYRGTMETCHWRSWEEDEGLIDSLAVSLGPCREQMTFFVCEPIVTDIEDGMDSWSIDGQWPELCLRGIEAKDRAYLGAVSAKKDLPDYIQEIQKKFAPVLARFRSRGFFSMEIRVAKDAAYFIDPTPRGPLPGTSSHLMVWENLADVIWAGAHGELIEPEPAAEFTAECLLTMDSADEWRVFEIPKELEPWIKISDCCEVDGKIGIPPQHAHGEEIGWMVAVEDTPTKVIKKLKEQASKLPDGVKTRLDALVELVHEEEKMQSAGVPITDEKMPNAAAVVE